MGPFLHPSQAKKSKWEKCQGTIWWYDVHAPLFSRQLKKTKFPLTKAQRRANNPLLRFSWRKPGKHLIFGATEHDLGRGTFGRPWFIFENIFNNR
jgi:hypothetical protein